MPLDPGSDRTPPVLDSLNFDPPQITDGGSTALTIRARDDLSGVRAVTGIVRSPSGAAMLSFEGQGDSDGSVFVARITIPSKAETGLWYIANLYVHDRADNMLINTFSAATVPPGGALRVSSPQSDSTAPDVRGVWVEKGAVRGGEANLIRIDVVDDGSGVASVSGAFQSPSMTALLSFACLLNAESGSWETRLVIPANADCGEWTLQNLRVTDKAGNSAFLSSASPHLGGVSFGVSSDDCDATPPTLDSLNLAPTIVSNETSAEVLVTASIHDEGSGATSMTGWVSGPASTNGWTPKISFICARTSSDPDSPWTGKILVPQYAAKGTWKVGRIRLLDRANNAREYTAEDAVAARISFEVE